jgi:hypothetical protein
MSLLSDDEILNSAASTLGEMHVENCGLGDIKDFARAVEAAILAKLASAELPEPYGWAKQSEIEQNARLGGSINLWRKKFDNDTTFYTADQLRQAYAQGAASQLADKPSAWSFKQNRVHRRLTDYCPPDDAYDKGTLVELFTLKEPK